MISPCAEAHRVIQMLSDPPESLGSAETASLCALLDPCGVSYTERGFLQGISAHGACTMRPSVACTFPWMATDAEWRTRIGRRIQELRTLRKWSLTRLARETGDRLIKSAISNYEQGTRMPGPEEASVLAEALEESPAHILCLDDNMPALSKTEAKLIEDLRALPESERSEYADRIAILASAYKKAVPHERLMRTGYDPAKRPRGAKVQPKRPIGKHDQ